MPQPKYFLTPTSSDINAYLIRIFEISQHLHQNETQRLTPTSLHLYPSPPTTLLTQPCFQTIQRRLRAFELKYLQKVLVKGRARLLEEERIEAVVAANQREGEQRLA